MSLSDLASLGSFVSGFAVLVSLFLLYFQLRQLNQQARQTEKNQKAAISQGRAKNAMDVLASGTEPSVADALDKGMRGEEGVSETRLRQFYQYSRALFWNWEEAFYQHEDGLLAESAFYRLKVNIDSLMRNIGIQAQWRIQRQTFGAEFVAWMNRLVAETRIDKPTDPLVLWRSALEEVRAGASL
jgi:hypothetical protein